MRVAYAHEAVVTLDEGGDTRAPGGAITVALCGAIDHEPPCPLAAHHTAAVSTEDGGLTLRVLFAAAPGRADEVRDRIDTALAAGAFRDTRWQLIRSGCVRIADADREHARRLLRC
jgi:hypothetical protein